MGVMAPSPVDQFQVMLGALVSYNRPVYLVVLFVMVFVSAYIVSKKKVTKSIIIALISTLLLAVYFIVSFTSQVRY